MKNFYLLLIAFVAINHGVFGQYAINGAVPFGNAAAGTSGDVNFDRMPNGTLIFLAHPTNSGQRSYRLVTTTATGTRAEVGPAGCSANLQMGNLDGSVITGQIGCTTQSFRTNGSVNYYVFKTKAGNGSASFIFWRLSAPVRRITARSSSVVGGSVEENQAVSVTGTLGNNQPASNGQTMYLRYSTDNFVTSTVTQMTDNNNGTFTGSLPGQSGGTTVNYFLFTSAKNSTNAVVTAADADLRTITYDNNGGSNYSYTVASAALPVTYSAWAAKRSGADVALSWATGSEAGAAYFLIERSGSEKADWTPTGTLSAINRPGGGHYSYTDHQAPPESLIYRLKQVDADGKFTYSDIRTVNGLESVTRLDVWPQPASTEQIRIRLLGTRNQFALLYAADGRLLSRFALTGETQALSVRQLEPGIYFLRTEGPDPVSRRFVIR